MQLGRRLTSQCIQKIMHSITPTALFGTGDQNEKN